MIFFFSLRWNRIKVLIIFIYASMSVKSKKKESEKSSWLKNIVDMTKYVFLLFPLEEYIRYFVCEKCWCRMIFFPSGLKCTTKSTGWEDTWKTNIHFWKWRLNIAMHQLFFHSKIQLSVALTEQTPHNLLIKNYNLIFT